MEFIKDIFRGAAIGVANIIPGVSGGTLMVAMGIYQDVISAVTGFFRHPIRSVRLLLPYAIGMFTGIVGLSFAIGGLFERYPFQTAMLFIGLIFGGLPVICKKIRGRSSSGGEKMIFMVSFALMIWMQFWETGGQKELAAGKEILVPLFLVGTVAAATMVIPGVSGSMILMALGYYTPIIEQINAFIRSAVKMEPQGVLFAMAILVPFGMGVAVGVFLVAKLVEYLLEKQERKTYFAILGLIVSSPAAILLQMDLGTPDVFKIITGILLFIVGMALTWALEKQ